MRLHELTAFPEEQKKRKRIGRGQGSGSGCTSGKGHKGQNSRAGGGTRPGFEGGQMPLQRRLPKRGFKNALFKVTYVPLNVGRILDFFPEQESITIEDMYERGLCKRGAPVKVLGQGDVSRAVSIQAHRFSTSAADKITKAGGKAEALEG